MSGYEVRVTRPNFEVEITVSSGISYAKLKFKELEHVITPDDGSVEFHCTPKELLQFTNMVLSAHELYQAGQDDLMRGGPSAAD
jgi:hypothetical protein